MRCFQQCCRVDTSGLTKVCLSKSMHELQTANIQIGRQQAEYSDLRNSVGRSQSTENRDAENLRNMRGENLRQLAVIERLIFGTQETEFETARTESPQEDAQPEHRILACRRDAIGSRKVNLSECVQFKCSTCEQCTIPKPASIGNERRRHGVRLV